MKIILAMVLAGLMCGPCLAATFTASAPLPPGSVAKAHQMIVFTNRSTLTTVAVAVTVTAVDRITGAQFTFPVQNVTIPAAINNPVTGALGQTGEAMVHIQLKDSGFQAIDRIITVVQVTNPPQGFTWISFLSKGSRLLLWMDQRRFKAGP